MEIVLRVILGLVLVGAALAKLATPRAIWSTARSDRALAGSRS